MQNPKIIEAPGTTVDLVEMTRPCNAAFVSNTRMATALLPFKVVKHLLSDRPLRRPNRAAPSKG